MRHKVKRIHFVGIGGSGMSGIAMKQLETTPAALAQLLRGLTREKLATMARAARALGRPEATRRCAALCEELALAA